MFVLDKMFLYLYVPTASVQKEKIKNIRHVEGHKRLRNLQEGKN